MFKKGQRLVHKSLPGEYEVVTIDNRNIMEVAEVDNEYPKKKWTHYYFRLDDCKDDWHKINQ